MNPFYTIGHATRSIEEFVALLQESSIDLLVDVRSFPRSRTNPQFNIDTFGDALALYGIGYKHILSLGGRRNKSKFASPNGFWTHSSFRNYADYAMSDDFHKGLQELIDLGRRHRLAYMCSETVWWRCHRRLITDYLLSRGEEVFHILGPNNVTVATINKSAHICGDHLEYPDREPLLL